MLLILLFHLKLEELLLNGFLLCHHHPHPGLDAHSQLLPVPAPYVRAPVSMPLPLLLTPSSCLRVQGVPLPPGSPGQAGAPPAQLPLYLSLVKNKVKEEQIFIILLDCEY